MIRVIQDKKKTMSTMLMVATAINSTCNKRISDKKQSKNSFSLSDLQTVSCVCLSAQSNLLCNFYFFFFFFFLFFFSLWFNRHFCFFFFFIILFINSLLYPNKMIKNIFRRASFLTFNRRLFFCLFLVWDGRLMVVAVFLSFFYFYNTSSIGKELFGVCERWWVI